MTGPHLLAQLSDSHLHARWEGVDPVPPLEAAVRAVGGLDVRPEALLVSGDLVDDGSASGYREVRGMLGELGLPIHPVMGNHDDRAAMRAEFGLPGGGDEPVNYAERVAGWRLLVIDSTIPGADDGAIDAVTEGWLAGELARGGSAPTILSLHHPPLLTGIPAVDRVGLAAESRERLAALLSQHPQVRLVATGHIHRPIAGALGGRRVLVCPSTYMQGTVEFGAEEIDMVAGPAGYWLHTLGRDDVVSQLQPIP